MALEKRAVLSDLSRASKLRMPTCTKRVMVSACVAAASVSATCIYSAFRIQSSENDFQLLQQTQLKSIARQVMLGVERQLTTSVSSTKALSALVNFDDGQQLLDPISPAVDDPGATSQELDVPPPPDEDAAIAPDDQVNVDNLTLGSDAINNIILNSSSIKFNGVADSLISTYRGISNLQLAPGGITSAIYPLQGNEQDLGTSLVPWLSSDIAASVTSRSVLFSGPLTLRSGKRGIIAYNPTFVDDPDFVGPYSDDRSWWGFTGMICSLDDFFLVTPIASDELVDLSYVLYARTSVGVKLLAASADIPGNETEEGDASTWYSHAVAQSPVTTSFELQLLGVKWEMLVWPKAGWQEHSDTFILQLALFAFFTVFSIIGMYSMLVRESVLQQVAGVIGRYAEPTPKEVWSALASIVPSPSEQGTEPALLV